MDGQVTGAIQAHHRELFNEQRKIERRIKKAEGDYRPHRPGWELPVEFGLIGAGFLGGAAGTHHLVRNHTAIAPKFYHNMDMLGGSLGIVGGGLAGTGIQSVLDRKDPERRPLREEIDAGYRDLNTITEEGRRAAKLGLRHRKDPDTLKRELGQLSEQRRTLLSGDQNRKGRDEMNERLQKVAYDLQNAYDYYRGRVDDMNKSLEENAQTHVDYKEHQPRWETPAVVAAPLLGMGAGALAGNKLTRRFVNQADDVALAGAVAGGGAGLIGGALTGMGIERFNDRRDPERREIRQRMSDTFDDSMGAMRDVGTMQDVIGRRGAEDPLAVYPMLQPGDEHDREIEDMIRKQLDAARAEQTERSELERELLRAHVERERSKAGLTNSKAALNINQIMQSQG